MYEQSKIGEDANDDLSLLNFELVTAIFVSIILICISGSGYLRFNSCANMVIEISFIYWSGPVIVTSISFSSITRYF